MKAGRYKIVAWIIIVFSTWACSNNNNKFYNEIDQYYHAEIFTNSFKDIYGEWILKAVSGDVSPEEYSPEFERIVIEKIGLFKVFRNDTLLGYGRINIKENNDHSLKISFLPDRGLRSMIFYQSEKQLFLKEDHLNLFASCCDHNYHFERLQ